MRFLLSRRWILFFVAVAVATWLAVQLGQWQFNRLDERKDSNHTVAHNLDQPPVPIAELMSPDRPTTRGQEWRRVTAHGTWDDEHTIVLKYQTRDNAAGVDVITPLVTSTGQAVLVNRGWMATKNTSARPDLPAVDEGTVTVTGWVRRDATGSASRVSDLSTRALSSRSVSKVVPYPLYRGFLQLDVQSPTPVAKLTPVDLPDDTSNGPHFFYGLQWWFFGVMAAFGFCYLAWDEWRQKRQPKPVASADLEDPEELSEGPEHAAVDGQHGAVHER